MSGRMEHHGHPPIRPVMGTSAPARCEWREAASASLDDRFGGRGGWLLGRCWLGGVAGRLGLGAHGRLDLLLAGQCGSQRVGVLERPAEQGLAVGGARPGRGGERAQFGRPGGSGLHQLLERGEDAPLLALLQPA
jgi:hypothetical protein